MKVQHDTGWYSLINKALQSKKSTDKIEEIDSKFSQYSDISSLTNVWTAKHSWRRKHRQKLQKRHRFPPSLLTSRAADFWNTLLPLRANCSCSSVSVDDKYSRLSCEVSISDATFGSNSDSSVPSIKETPVRGTLGHTLEHTHLAFESLIGRIVRLLSILIEKSDSSSSQICSDSNLKILALPNSKSEKNTEMLDNNNHCRLPSVTSLSSDHYRENWSASGRTGKKWESSSQLEIAERKRCVKGFFSSSPLVSKTLRVPKSVLTKEELVYLLQNKKSLLSEYFQRQVDSTDLKKKLNSSERETLVYGTQSDSRLQEDNLQFVQFITERRRNHTEDKLEENFDSLEAIRSNTSLTSLSNEDSCIVSTPKRRVTFSDPLAKNTTSLLNCWSSDNEDGILSGQSFTTVIRNNIDQRIQSDDLFDSKSVSPSDSSVSLKACFANLSLESRSAKADDPNLDLNESNMEQKTDRRINITDGSPGFNQREHNDNVKSRENSPCYDTSDINMAEEEFLEDVDAAVSVMTVEKYQSDENEGVSNECWRSVSPSSLQKLNNLVIRKGLEIIDGGKPTEVKILVEEILDSGTTHTPVSNHVGTSIILKVDDTTPQVIFEECIPQRNSEEDLKRKICPTEIREDCNSADHDHCASDHELEDELIRNKCAKCDEQKSSKSFSKEQEFSDTHVNNRPYLPIGKTVTFEDKKEIHPLLKSEDKWIPSSELNGGFELSWKGCWDQQSTKHFDQDTRQLEANHTEDGGQFFESYPDEIPSDSVWSTRNETYSAEVNSSSQNDELSAEISGSQLSYYTTMDDESQFANDHKSKRKSRNFRANFSSSYLHPSNNPCFMAVADSLEKDEPIPWAIMSREDCSKPCKPVSKFANSFMSNPEAMRVQNRTELRKGLSNVCKRIINPEIWRSEVHTTFSKSDWYAQRGSWKKPKIQNDWLLRKLEELQSDPETDYESDYHAGSEIESDFQCERDLSPIKRSFSNLDTRSENCRRFKMRRNRLRQNLFLDKILSRRKIIFNECQCHKNTRSNRYDLRPRDHDLYRHTTFEETDQRSNKNLFSHLRARMILDSETDDSEFALSTQTDFCYDFKRRDEHVNKMKCRRFVKSLRSINSEEGRKIPSTGPLHVTLKKSFSPASVKSALSTRTVGTNVSEKKDSSNMMDVCIDTSDLCPYEPIGTINLNKNSSCQTLESSFGTFNSFQYAEAVPKASPFLFGRDTPSGANIQIPRSDELRISNALASLSNQIINASNKLAQLRFSDITTESEKFVISPATKGDDFDTTHHTSPTQSTPPIFLHPEQRAPSSANQTSNILENSNSYIVEKKRCEICNSSKKPSERYSLPACIVKGAGRVSNTNEKDPWNRVMEQAKAHHRYKGRNTSSSLLEMKSTMGGSSVAASVCGSSYSKSCERKQNSSSSDESCTEEVRIRIVQVQNNSPKDRVVCDHGHPTSVDKLPMPPMKDRRIKLPPASTFCSSTSSDLSMSNLTRTLSPRRKNRNPQTTVPNNYMSNRLLYIISEKAEPTHYQVPKKSPAANLFT